VTCLVTIPLPNFINLDVYYNIVIIFMTLLVGCVQVLCHSYALYLWQFFEKLPYIIYGIVDYECRAMTCHSHGAMARRKGWWVESQGKEIEHCDPIQNPRTRHQFCQISTMFI
jgi:hypothetical protein